MIHDIFSIKYDNEMHIKLTKYIKFQYLVKHEIDRICNICDRVDKTY